MEDLFRQFAQSLGAIPDAAAVIVVTLVPSRPFSTTSRPLVLSRLHEEILDIVNEHGVQIMSPHFEGQPEHPAVVDRSRWFAEPAKSGATVSKTDLSG